MVNDFGTPYQTITSKTADYTVTAGDDVILVDASAGAVTITLYTPIGNYPNGSQLSDVGTVRVVKTDAGSYPVTIATAAGSIVGPTVLRQQNQGALYTADGVGTWYSFSPNPSSYETQVSISSADILALNATPKTLIQAQGSGKVVIVESILLKMVTTATQYANGGALEFRYTNASGAKVTADIAAAVVTAAAATSYTSVAGVTTSLTDVANAAIICDNATAAFITGTGTAVATIKWRCVTP